MEPSMKDNSIWTNNMVEGARYFPMESTILATSPMIKLMAMVYSKISMVASMKETGKMTNNMDLAKKSGTMEQKLTKVSFWTAKRMAKASLCGVMVPTTKETSSTVYLKE